MKKPNIYARTMEAHRFGQTALLSGRDARKPNFTTSAVLDEEDDGDGPSTDPFRQGEQPADDGFDIRDLLLDETD